MDTNQIMSAIFLIAVLILILPNFLSTNNKLKEFFENLIVVYGCGGNREIKAKDQKCWVLQRNIALR